MFVYCKEIQKITSMYEFLINSDFFQQSNEKKVHDVRLFPHFCQGIYIFKSNPNHFIKEPIIVKI